MSGVLESPPTHSAPRDPESSLFASPITVPALSHNETARLAWFVDPSDLDFRKKPPVERVEKARTVEHPDSQLKVKCGGASTGKLDKCNRCCQRP